MSPNPSGGDIIIVISLKQPPGEKTWDQLFGIYEVTNFVKTSIVNTKKYVILS